MRSITALPVTTSLCRLSTAGSIHLAGNLGRSGGCGLSDGIKTRPNIGLQPTAAQGIRKVLPEVVLGGWLSGAGMEVVK
jgi:hypothetical protein